MWIKKLKSDFIVTIFKQKTRGKIRFLFLQSQKLFKQKILFLDFCYIIYIVYKNKNNH